MKIEDFKKHALQQQELSKIRGGFFRSGPEDLISDDVDIPDLITATGPDDLVEDDIDIPDLLMGIKKAFSKRSISKGIKLSL